MRSIAVVEKRVIVYAPLGFSGGVSFPPFFRIISRQMATIWSFFMSGLSRRMNLMQAPILSVGIGVILSSYAIVSTLAFGVKTTFVAVRA